MATLMRTKLQVWDGDTVLAEWNCGRDSLDVIPGNINWDAGVDAQKL